MNDLIACAFTSAGIPSSKEPHGLVRSDGKWPDGLTLVPWKGGKPLAWDVTAVCTVADSYVAATAREAGAAAERVAELKIAKLEGKCIFQPIVVELLGSLNETACQFMTDLRRRISAQSGDEREREWLSVPKVLLSFSDSTLSCSTTVLSRQITWPNQ